MPLVVCAKFMHISRQILESLEVSMQVREIWRMRRL